MRVEKQLNAMLSTWAERNMSNLDRLWTKRNSSCHCLKRAAYTVREKQRQSVPPYVSAELNHRDGPNMHDFLPAYMYYFSASEFTILWRFINQFIIIIIIITIPATSTGRLLVITCGTFTRQLMSGFQPTFPFIRNYFRNRFRSAVPYFRCRYRFRAV